MSQVDELRNRREEILAELGNLDQFRRGSVTEQYVEAVRKDGTKIRRGPYPVYTFKEKGKTVSRRIKEAERVALYREQIEGFRRFQQLTEELREIGERISDLVISEQTTSGVKKTSKKKSRSKKPQK